MRRGGRVSTTRPVLYDTEGSTRALSAAHNVCRRPGAGLGFHIQSRCPQLSRWRLQDKATTLPRPGGLYRTLQVHVPRTHGFAWIGPLRRPGGQELAPSASPRAPASPDRDFAPPQRRSHLPTSPTVLYDSPDPAYAVLASRRACERPEAALNSRGPLRPFSCFRQFSATRTRERQDAIQHYAYVRLQRATRTFKSGSAVLALTVSLRPPESLPLDSARSQPLTRDLTRFPARGNSRLTPRAIPARDAHVQVRERGFCAYSQSPGPTSPSHDCTTSRPLRHFNTRPTTPRLRVRAVPATHDVPAPRTCAPSRSQPSSAPPRDFGALLRVLRREACPGS